MTFTRPFLWLPFDEISTGVAAVDRIDRWRKVPFKEKPNGYKVLSITETGPGGIVRTGAKFVRPSSGVTPHFENTNFKEYGCGDNPWSICVRWRHDALPANVNQYIVSKAMLNEEWKLYRNGANLFFRMYDATRNSFIMPIGNNLTLTIGKDYFATLGHDSVTNEMFVDIIDDAGVYYHSHRPGIPSDIWRYYVPMCFGNRHGGSNDGMTGVIWEACGFLQVLSEAQQRWLWNNGVKRTLAEVIIDPEPVIEQPPVTILSVTPSWKKTTEPDINGNGLYWLNCFEVNRPEGKYTWLRSSDHAATVAAQTGIKQGWSNSPQVVPSTWTVAVPKSGTNGGKSYTGIETGRIVFAADEGLYFLYAHGPAGTAGVTNSQITFLWTSTNCLTWTAAGVAIPNAKGPNHTGYARLYRRGPGDWIGTHLNTASVGSAGPPSDGWWWFAGDMSAVSISPDGRIWSMPGQVFDNQTSNPANLGYRLIGDVVTIGGQLWMIGKEGRSDRESYLSMQRVSSTLQPYGVMHRLIQYGQTGVNPFPGAEYLQSVHVAQISLVNGFPSPNAQGRLHVYPQRYFYNGPPVQGREEVDLVILQVNP